MTKLHEILAVEGTLKGQADKVRQDLGNTFEKKRHLFSKKIVTFDPFEEGAQSTVEEQSDLQSTVESELKWITPILAKALDASFRVARSNTKAAADVVLESGQTILQDIPATALLELEKRCGELRGLIMKIPTLDPAKGFHPDLDQGDGVYAARAETRTRTKKTPRAFELAPATKEHPAQVQALMEDIPIGTLTTLEWSGMLTPADKSDILARVDEVQCAVKKARARANQIEAESGQIGHTLLHYIFGLSSS